MLSAAGPLPGDVESDDVGATDVATEAEEAGLPTARNCVEMGREAVSWGRGAWALGVSSGRS